MRRARLLTAGLYGVGFSLWNTGNTHAACVAFCETRAGRVFRSRRGERRSVHTRSCGVSHRAAALALLQVLHRLRVRRHVVDKLREGSAGRGNQRRQGASACAAARASWFDQPEMGLHQWRVARSYRVAAGGEELRVHGENGVAGPLESGGGAVEQLRETTLGEEQRWGHSLHSRALSWQLLCLAVVLSSEK